MCRELVANDWQIKRDFNIFKFVTKTHRKNITKTLHVQRTHHETRKESLCYREIRERLQCNLFATLAHIWRDYCAANLSTKCD